MRKFTAMAKGFSFDKLADLNPCVAFIVDNYDMLCVAHPGKTVMVMNGGPAGAYIAKIFDSMFQAMFFTQSMKMGHVPYALKSCDGSPVELELLFSFGCKTPR